MSEYEMSRDCLKAKYEAFLRRKKCHIIHYFSNPNSDDYIGQKLREKCFDPKGMGTCTALDDLVKTHHEILIICPYLMQSCLL